MKRFTLWFTIFFLVILAGCGLKTKMLSEFYEDQLKSIDEMRILDGSTGYSKNITDEKMIDEFLSLIETIQYIPDDNQEKRVGFRYAITLFDGNNSFSFTLNEVDGHYYDTEPDIFPIVDNFYKNLAVEEK